MNDNPDLAPRETAIARFRDVTGAPGFQRIIQRGRERDTADYTLELSDGRTIRVGGIDVLWSQAEFGKTLAVTTGTVMRQLKRSDWQNAIAALFWLATDVEDPPEETSEAQAEDIIATYLPATPNVDRDHACTGRLPWTDEQGTTHIHPRHLQQYVARELGERASLADMRRLLRTAGFQPRRIDYQRDAQTGDDERTSTVYYARANGRAPDNPTA